MGSLRNLYFFNDYLTAFFDKKAVNMNCVFVNNFAVR